jgi:hypothetical protein
MRRRDPDGKAAEEMIGGCRVFEPSGIRPRTSRPQHVAPGVMPRRFPTRWSIEERQESLIVKGRRRPADRLSPFPGSQRQMSMKGLSRDEAFLVEVNIAKLPSGPRQILKDIPRPPNSASRDD